MQWNANKNWLGACGLFAIATSSINADVDQTQMRNLENRVSALEQKKGSSGMVNPPARPLVKCGSDLSAFGELLVWQTEEILPIGVVNESGTPTTASSVQNLSHADAKNLKFNWDVGFRLGLDYDTCHDGWDVRLTWLHFNTRKHQDVRTDSDEVIWPSWIHPGLPTNGNPLVVNKAHANWKAYLNQIDLDLGREFFVSKWLTLRPFFGLRTSWLRQHYNVDYKKTVTFLNGNTPSGNVHTKNSNKWWGIGVVGGVNTQWGLGCGFSLYGDIAAAIEYGFHKLSTKTEPTSNIDLFVSDSDNFVNMNDSPRISHPILDLGLGVKWDHSFEQECIYLALQGGWEHHIYFGQNQMPLFTGGANQNNLGIFSTNQGDKTYQGWTFSVLLGF